MRTPLLIALSVLAYAAPVAAQDRIELYADRERTTCSITEPLSPPVVQVHVFLAGPIASTGVRFKAPKPDCWVGATWLGDALQDGLMAGTSQSDWSIGFGKCVDPSATPFYIGAISYLISGQALPCCDVDALPSWQFVFTDCAFRELPLAESKSIVVNPDETCGCQGGVTLAVEASTWGRVKSLYR